MKRPHVEHHRMGDLRNLQVHIPRALKQELMAAARRDRVTLRAIYTTLLTDFVSVHRGRRGKRARTLFLATRRYPQSAVLQMWLSATLYGAVTAIARQEGVSKRAVAYTALLIESRIVK